ncbi:conserved oligomeric Golgi complex subunit 1 [Marchantia polymorpha subsp. ruderalis]|uniref:Conserved oligomeric Golgi complex subunit 1 n=2 Tax=Marchantia polymorpha TaxID=3197 RepID=A0AAF6AYM8_MARPO|nr:hypothetical protein MARPO_0006s0304 [Marchantia polymorpha]BBN04862.1 hypothetical protein Mp_3g08300 [Marchantia polymorpha subsp. ruderalis]|eukprot:PTQ48313.1 hypothetical protein MARPO_0006s0304 [Marchantia polymorpha]
MRGGRFQQKAIEDANTRNAEALFETRTVVEIREVEARTRKEIEEKKEELRQLVGASYRDLIESADSILLMRKSCEAVADNIQKMEEGFDSLKNSITLSTVSSESDRERKRRESLFGIGSRVKYLVDTPEKIWGCLDEHMYLEGSERYLRAREVHSLLIETSGKGENAELLATFPLLRHQWPLVETFRGQISQRSRDRLQETGLKVGEYAIALAAVATIDELPSSQIFSLFLEMRRTWLRVHLRHAIAGRDRGITDKTASETKRGYADVLKSTPPEDNVSKGVSSSDLESTAAILCQLVHMIQASLCHVGELFLEVSGKMPLLFSTVLTAPPGSQLFGGIPYPEREVRLWKAQKEKLETRMGSLSAEYITESCVSWLRKCAGEIMVEGRLLLQRIKSGKELAEVERIVREDLAKQSALNDSLDWLKSAFGSSFDSPWDCLCELLLKEPTNLWDAIFEGMFVRRMKEVIETGFHSISIDELLKDSLSSEASAKGLGRQMQREHSSVTASTPWKYTENENLRSFSGLEGGMSVWKSLGDEKDNSSNSNSFLNPEVIKVKDRVDEGMRTVLEDSLSFLYGPQSTARTEELASYLQEQCRLCMISIVNVLTGKLSELSESMNKATGRKFMIPSNIASERVGTFLGSNGKALDPKSDESLETLVIIERALFLGRLSAALAKHSSVLPVILGSPLNWTLQDKSSVGSRGLSLERENSFADSPERWFPKRGKAGNAVSNEIPVKLKELQRMLRHQSISAHKMWVLWSAEKLIEAFTGDLEKDDCLGTLIPLKGWEETCLKQEEETGGEVEMKLALPAMPSTYAVSFLFAGCQEIYRVGGHALDRAVLQFFAWKLCEKVLKTYEDFFADSSVMNNRVSEKGLLQLLFDLRFLADVLSGGQDVSIENLDNEDLAHEALGLGSRRKAPTAQSDKSSQTRKKWVSNLLSTLPARLDPIDWATYEPHLWENERRYYQRCAVLFGSLIQLNRLYTDTVLKLPSHADTNTLNMTGTVPRFTYLPISAPIFSVSGGSASRMPRQLSQDDSSSGLWSGYNNSDDGYKYGSSDVQSQSSVASARPLIKSLMGQVGSRFGEGLKLGLLSDGQVERLKDKSAAAISTFGDMLPVQAAGLFSSLTAGGNKE